MKKDNSFFPKIIALMSAVGVGAGGTYFVNRDKIAFADKYPLMLETKKFVDETVGIDEPDPSDADVINAYLALYGDKYTTFTAADDEENADESILRRLNKSPTAAGSGFTMALEGGRFVFAEVESGMPAAAQGVQTGDVLVSVDGRTIETNDDARKLLGKDGTESELLLDRGGKQVKINFRRTNDQARAEGVVSEMHGTTLYVKFDSFGLTTNGALNEVFTSNKFDSLVLDLRENGGGETAVSVSLADYFIDAAEVCIHYKGGSESTCNTKDGREYDVPIVLLVGEHTASAAEMFTALLKQYGGAQLVGANTFGKGIFQELANFKGGVLKYTAGYYTVGDWECFQGTGIAPDIAVDMDDSLIGTEGDIQLETALETIGRMHKK